MHFLGAACWQGFQEAAAGGCGRSMQPPRRLLLSGGVHKCTHASATFFAPFLQG